MEMKWCNTYKLNEEGDLEGRVSTHVDDFDLAGRKKFVEMTHLLVQLQQKFVLPSESF